MDPEKFELNPDTAKSYAVADGCPPVFETHTHGTVDIRTVSASTVEGLIKAGSNKFTAKPVTGKGKAE